MRALTVQELELVAGGLGTTTSGGSTITVTGHPTSTWWPTFTYTTTGGGGGGGGGGEGGPDPHQITETANETPCVHTVPQGVDIHDLNNEMKYLADLCAQNSAADGNEWGGFVYRMPDGQLYETDPWTAGHPDDVNGAHVSIPTGAVIVGYVHTHPEDPAMDERMLSSEDRSFINTLISNYGADPNLVAYINTKDETGVAKTYAYDSSHRSATSPGCSL